MLQLLAFGVWLGVGLEAPHADQTPVDGGPVGPIPEIILRSVDAALVNIGIQVFDRLRDAD